MVDGERKRLESEKSNLFIKENKIFSDQNLYDFYVLESEILLMN